MIQYYFKVACRHLVRNKFITFINVVSLSVSIAAFLLIMQYVSFEWSYDRFHHNNAQIYRVAYEQFENGELKNNSARNFIGLQSLLKENFPEVNAFTGFDRTSPNAGFLFSYQGKTFYEIESFYQTDSNFFRVFPSLLMEGNQETALNDPHNLVISEKMAKNIFGNEDPIGKRIDNKSTSYADVAEFVVTGVMRDSPGNAHVHPNFVSLIHEDEVTPANYWNGPKLYTYLTITEGSSVAEIADRMNTLLQGLSAKLPKLNGVRISLQPITDIHLQSKLHDELEAPGNEGGLYILSFIGIIILVLAWINYINIETARFTSRLKEVGVRQIIGSNERDLVVQFLIEYCCVTMLAACTSMVFFKVALARAPYFTGSPIDNFELLRPTVWIGGMMVFVCGTIVAGICPAIFLLRIKPVLMLKGKLAETKRGVSVRKSLILIQFVSSMSLIGFLSVIYLQLDFMRTSNKRIDLERIVSVRNPFVYANDDDSINYTEYEALKNKLLQSTLVTNVTSSSAIPGTEINEYFTNRLKRNISDPHDPTRFRILFIDDDYIPFYDLKLSAGRNYASEMGDNENWYNVILNEKAALQLGFKSAVDAVDQEVHFHLWGRDFKKYKIIGVVENYHQESVKKDVEPIVLSLNHDRFQQVFYSIKLNQGRSMHDGVAYIEKCWKAVFPHKPFDYFFQDEFYDQQFKSEQHAGRVFTLFTGVAILIASLGILGVTLFEVSSRLREISIRKVLGASVTSLVSLLSRQYAIILLLSTLLSIPLILFAANVWLASYPMRADISPLILMIPFSVIAVIVMTVSGFQTIKAGLTNPVDHLRNE